MMEDIAIASSYNKVTGAGVTHRDVARWGFMETRLVVLAIELLDG